MDYDRELTGGVPPPPQLEAAFFHTARNDRAGLFGAPARSELVQRAVRLLSYGLLAVLAGILLVVATATVPILFGYHTYIVRGGSMEPDLRAGSAAVTRPASARALAVGDIIAFRAFPDSPPVLHRIVEIKSEGGQRLFFTQGDQNRTPDPEPVALAGPGDMVIYSVPYAGYILSFAQSALGRLALFGVPLAAFSAIMVRKWRRTAGQKLEPRALEIVSLEDNRERPVTEERRVA